MIRIPDSGRFECRLPDGAANPYLLPAALIAAGLDGINEKRDPGVSTHTNLYTDVIASTLPHLPSNLLDALRELEGNAILQNRLGPEFISAYLKLKYQEWNDYSSHLSRWELRHTMDC
jgi:glutamine synthetase